MYRKLNLTTLYTIRIINVQHDADVCFEIEIKTTGIKLAQ